MAHANILNWDGSPLTLATHDTAVMPQSPNGSAILLWNNVATVNNTGTLMLSVDAEAPQTLDAPAMMTAPSFLVNNWQSRKLTVANVSSAPNTPILIGMLGPGLPGIVPKHLVVGAPFLLASAHVAQGQLPPSQLLLTIRTNTTNLLTVVLLGGPTDAGGNNGYVFGVNFPRPQPPPGYTKVTTSSQLTFGPFDWGASSVFVANMSSQNAAPVELVFQLV